MASYSSSSLRLAGNYNYNVFCSFHGPDVRKTLLSHIRKQFESKEITMFDDQGIERSADIALSLIKAIRESRISIVILSKKYASSSWCLDELVEILECRKTIGQIVMTIFYRVDPSHVRKQIGDFGKAFDETCARQTDKERQKWSKALNEVSNIAGEDFSNWDNEARMIEKITKDVLDKLNATPSRDFDAHLREIQSWLDLDNVEVILNQSGMRIGHVGATEENLRYQRVLIILNDVNNLKQLESLAKETSWFGPGSRILVTTENKELLKLLGINNTYKNHNSNSNMADIPKEKKGLVPFASSSEFTLFNSLKPCKNSWTIRAKILHSWRRYSQINGESIKLILGDESGFKIGAVVKRDQVKRFANKLMVGQWKIIKNFIVTKDCGQYKPSDLLYKINFVEMTNVINCDSVNDESFISLARFDHVLSGDLKTKVLIDIVGQVVTIGEMQIVYVHGKETKKIDFVMRDNYENHLNCTLWGKYAEILNGACLKSSNESVYCLIRYANINVWKENLNICNAFDASIVSTDQTIPEIKDFKHLFPNESLYITPMTSKKKARELTYGSQGFCLQYPRKTVSELLETSEVGKYCVKCTIDAIDTDPGWFYFGCKKCNKKVIKETAIDYSHALPNQKPKFYCEKCKDYFKSVSTRYKLHVHIMDHTGKSKCMLFDSCGVEVVGETTNSLLGGCFDEIEDPEVLPEPIKNTVGKSFQFLICVERKNISKYEDTFRVCKVWSGNNLVEEMKTELSHMPSSNDDQHVLMLSKSGEVSEITMSNTTTPSSKRKEVDGSDQLPDNKKHCNINLGNM